MFITKKILEDYNISQTYLDMFNTLYPNGEEFSNMLSNVEIPNDFFHWVFLYLPLTDSEKARYRDRLNIKESQFIYNSKNIESCSNVFSSRNCAQSSFIKKSSIVDSSHMVINSSKVRESERVFDSKKVEKSKLVIKSDTVINSTNVWLSKKIYNSSSIFRGESIYNGDYLLNCKQLEDCYFCANCSLSSTLMFSYNARGDSYMIFNKPVSKEEFNETKNFFKEKYNILLNYGRAPSTLEETINELEVYENFTKHFSTLTEEFYEDVKKLPQYDPFIMYCITFNPTFIERNDEDVKEESDPKNEL